MLRIINMVPLSQSYESNQDSEPNLAVNPDNPNEMVATAFTPNPMGGKFAPIYVSIDGGETWSLNSIVPGNNPVTGTHDITGGFATAGNPLFAANLNGLNGKMQILRTSSFNSSSIMT